MAFHDVQLPTDIERGAIGGPSFQTTVLEVTSGREQRNVGWEFSRIEFDVAYGIQEEIDYAIVKEFFYARRGMAHTFRFRDWSDYVVTAGTIGTGDGTTTAFQCVKYYSEGDPGEYVRTITRPDADTLVVYLNGTPTTAFTLGDLGVINFNSAPGGGVAITADFEFDVPVRFDTDKFNLDLELVGIGKIGTLPIIEVRE